MTIIPDKHTFTIWQGATFFEVLTLYETLDTSTPRDFFTSSSITGVTITTNGTINATLGGTYNTLSPNTKYYVSSTYIDATKGIYFTTGGTVGTSVTLSSNAGVTTGTAAATITNRTAAYSAEMIIRDKPQGTDERLILSTDPNNADSGCSITFADSPQTLGRIELQITASRTASLAWKTGVYDLTITNTSTDVTDALLYGGIKVNGV